MQATRRMEAEPFTTRVIASPDESWAQAIANLDMAGMPVPLTCRPEFATSACSQPMTLVAAYDAAGRCRAALGLEVGLTRALPGHRLARSHHLGSVLASDAGAAVLARLRELAAQDKRMLRVNLEFILRSADEQRRVAAVLAHLGFRRVEQPRNYRDTLVIDLAGTEQTLLGSFSATTRRELRQWSQRPVELRAIEDARYSARLNAISRETLARTGGRFEPRPWAERIQLGKALPAHSRLVGLFRAGHDDPQALLAYAWGCVHGDYAEYDDAGSTRVEDIKVSMMYPLMWDLICWAQRSGCRWFNMGGSLSETVPGDDPRAGIDGFKRRFSKQVERVGDEWVLEPHPLRARAAAAVRTLGERFGLKT
jgi:hypothetical protein